MKTLLISLLVVICLVSSLAAGGLVGLSLLPFDREPDSSDPLPPDGLENLWLGWLYIGLDSEDPVLPDPPTCWTAIMVWAGRVLGEPEGHSGIAASIKNERVQRFT